MFGDLTEGPHHGPQHVLHSLKNQFFKRMEYPSNDIEMHHQPSTSQKEKQNAVCVRNAHKSYGTINPFVVLDGLEMTVPKGCIYGLLGASGCGKTTLLGCIVGRKRLNAGEICVLGGTPGSKGSGVPGPRIGYMPQETGLYGEFSIQETFFFFGRIAGMTQKRIQERFQFLTKLLMLPVSGEMLKNLSGGQQRRVSLATALLHEPELLILDEPTVGVGPLIRQLIWDHLVDITKGGRTTVIITTHYIEETRNAHLVGLMRGGYFLAEEPPEKLILQYNAETLEEVFLKLSVVQNTDHQCHRHAVSDTIPSTNGVPTKSATITDADPSNPDTNAEIVEESKYKCKPEAETVIEKSQFFKNTNKIFIFDMLASLWVFKASHMRALVWKNLLWLNRNKPVLLFITFLPVLLVVLFCSFVGRDPINLPVAIVNYETNNTVACDRNLDCGASQLSCSYLGYLEKRALILMYYDSEASARQSVLDGDTFASIVVGHNYSDALRARVNDWQGSEPWDIAYSDIYVFRDVANKHIANYLKVYLYDTFQKFIQDYLEVCHINKKVLTVPIKWETPIYGTMYPNFTDFAIPGILLSIAFFVALALTAGAMLIERNEGSLERAFVIGINEVELLAAHIICEFGIMLTQSTLAMICAFAIFDMTLKGSLILVVILTVLTGFCGMCYGLLISCVCNSDLASNFMAVGSFVPMLMMCGIIWPIEAMHPWLQPFAFAFPLTKATESMRSILQRNWGLGYESVYMGYISISIWIIVFLTISILFLKFKRD